MAEQSPAPTMGLTNCRWAPVAVNFHVLIGTIIFNFEEKLSSSGGRELAACRLTIRVQKLRCRADRYCWESFIQYLHLHRLPQYHVWICWSLWRYMVSSRNSFLLEAIKLIIRENLFGIVSYSNDKSVGLNYSTNGIFAIQMSSDVKMSESGFRTSLLTDVKSEPFGRRALLMGMNNLQQVLQLWSFYRGVVLKQDHVAVIPCDAIILLNLSS